MMFRRATVGLFACGLIPLCRVDCLTPSYPEVCIDDDSSFGRYNDGEGNWVSLCKWTSMFPSKRCRQMCPCKDDPKPISEICRQTCSNCPLVPSAEPTTAPTPHPTDSPSESPTETHSSNPTSVPTITPTKSPTDSPTGSPTTAPTPHPTDSPSEFLTETPTMVPSKCKNSDTSKTMITNGTIVALCDWARVFPKERCDKKCPCGADAGVAIRELCPETCDSCETRMPSASPSNTVTLQPSTAPSICDDDDECHMVGESHTHDLIELCHYAGKKLSRCNKNFMDGLIKDYCRHTCYVCRDMPETPKTICKDDDEKCRAVPMGNELVHLCKGFVLANLTRCDELVEDWVVPEEIPAGDPQYLKDICRESCGVCTPPTTSPITTAPTSSSPTTSPTTTAPTMSPTVCKDDDEKCRAIPQGDTFMLLCEEFVFSDLTRCNEPVKRWVYSGDIPDGNPEKLKDICRKTCDVCTGVGQASYSEDGEDASSSGSDNDKQETTEEDSDVSGGGGGGNGSGAGGASVNGGLLSNSGDGEDASSSGSDNDKQETTEEDSDVSGGGGGGNGSGAADEGNGSGVGVASVNGGRRSNSGDGFYYDEKEATEEDIDVTDAPTSSVTTGATSGTTSGTTSGNT